MEKKTITIEYDDYSNENATLDEALKLNIGIENEMDALEKETPDNTAEITEEQMIKTFSIMATNRSAAISHSKLTKEK